jgi:hypothetical protein
MTGIALRFHFHPLIYLYIMSLAKSMNTRKVRRVMTKMEDGLSKASLCSRPGFDLEYMFTVDSQIDDPETKVSCSPANDLIVDF